VAKYTRLHLAPYMLIVRLNGVDNFDWVLQSRGISSVQRFPLSGIQGGAGAMKGGRVLSQNEGGR
jgi:hypothetical protein